MPILQWIYLPTLSFFYWPPMLECSGAGNLHTPVYSADPHRWAWLRRFALDCQWPPPPVIRRHTVPYSNPRGQELTRLSGPSLLLIGCQVRALWRGRNKRLNVFLIEYVEKGEKMQSGGGCPWLSNLNTTLKVRGLQRILPQVFTFKRQINFNVKEENINMKLNEKNQNRPVFWSVLLDLSFYHNQIEPWGVPINHWASHQDVLL